MDQHLPKQNEYNESDIAIIGMACRFPEAPSLQEFWRLLCAGKSTCGEIPSERFSQQDRTYWASLCSDIDAFDNKFFKMTGREASFVDPQQRVILEVAYEALQAAHQLCFAPAQTSVGCYLGIAGVDYTENVASHDSSAFSATGILRAFVPGRISHHFGWTGPSISYDTACSSSLVAIISACAALRANECSMALAGGINLLTSPVMYRHLDRAGFLSRSGPCKAFDVSADGYCRGEGAGAVVLKTVPAALADGDEIHAVIRGTAINQTLNSTPITVSNCESLGNLFKKALDMAGFHPSQVSYVEAHGTGTPVGDPIEMQSIRNSFGRSDRSEKLLLGTVKANIGHVESASGVAGMIKGVLMLRNRIAPKQAHFSSLNPKIDPLETVKIEIPTTTQQWDGASLCLSNYGASGSNAAAIVSRPWTGHDMTENAFRDPGRPSGRPLLVQSICRKYPIIISSMSEDGLQRNCEKLAQWIRTELLQPGNTLDLASLAFQLNNRFDATHQHLLSLSASDLNETEAAFRSVSKSTQSAPSQPRIPQVPLVMCFGGQTRDYIGLDKGLYEECLVFKKHLDRVHDASLAMKGPSLVPEIFVTTSIDDVVQLQSMLFAVQYACAQSWLDCGLRIDHIIGHSFGQLTAFCVAGAIDLLTALKLIQGRATLMRDHWGPDKGAMLAVDCPASTVSPLLSLVENTVDIACFNSESTLVFTGPVANVAALEKRLEDSKERFGPIKYQRLWVTHAFHSSLVDKIVPQLKDLCSELDFQDTKIPVEICTEHEEEAILSADQIAAHARQPIFFCQAVNRIASRYGDCAWLEAGANQGIAALCRRALKAENRSRHSFYATDLTAKTSWNNLADTTVALRKSGLKVQFWPFHRKQRHRYISYDLPPYQFEKRRHWLELKVPTAQNLDVVPSERPRSEIVSLVSFSRPSTMTAPNNLGRSFAEYSVNVGDPRFKAYTAGHSVGGVGLCPASLFVSLACAAVQDTRKTFWRSSDCLAIEDLQLRSPLIASAQHVIICLENSDATPLIWSFTISSYSLNSSKQRISTVVHAQGNVVLTAEGRKSLSHNNNSSEQFMRTTKITLLERNFAETTMEGTYIYRMFSVAVEYQKYYHGIRRIAIMGEDAAGRVLLPESDFAPESGWPWVPILFDNLLQVAGLHANCFQNTYPGEFYVCIGIGTIHVHTTFDGRQRGPWDVACKSSPARAREIRYDIMLFDPENSVAVVSLSGVRFWRTSKTSMFKNSANTDQLGRSYSFQDKTDSSSVNMPKKQAIDNMLIGDREPLAQNKEASTGASYDSSGTAARMVISSLTDAPEALISEDSSLVDVGIDSLMITELAKELGMKFDMKVPVEDLQRLDTFGSLCSYLRQRNPDVVQKDNRANGSTGVSVEGDPHQSNKQEPVTETLHAPISSKWSASDELRRAANQPCLNGSHFENLQFAEGICSESFDKVSEVTHLRGYMDRVYLWQLDLTAHYITEAFEKLGCSIAALSTGQQIALPSYLGKHSRLMSRLLAILSESGLVVLADGNWKRTSKQIQFIKSAEESLQRVLAALPEYRPEHELVGLTGPHLAECLAGQKEGVHIIFGDQSSRSIVEKFYTASPLLATATELFKQVLTAAVTSRRDGISAPLKIIEIGAGTGATTRAALEILDECSVEFEYTFTDISQSFVTAARSKFSSYNDRVRYKVLNIERPPEESLMHAYDITIATNTRSNKSVFGLLDGWWRFNDDRNHPIVSEIVWKRCLLAAGFSHVDWTRGSAFESKLVRVIIASAGDEIAGSNDGTNETLADMETIQFDQVGTVPLYVDVHYPEKKDLSGSKRPIALLIHPGGHVMLSRKDIMPVQRDLLLENGFLPVSPDYRLCPEIDVVSGAMHDVCTAYSWCRAVLPTLSLQRTDIKPDGNRVVVVGTSVGGHLGISTGWTSLQRGIRPPDAILAFYCPIIYTTDFWTRPHTILGLKPLENNRDANLWDAVRASPITGFSVTGRHQLGGWLTTGDARVNILLHMNYSALMIPVLLGALSSSQRRHSSMLRVDENANPKLMPKPGLTVQDICGLSQLQAGNYRTPTFLVHGTEDDFVPWQETQQFYEELQERGIDASVRIVKGAAHSFDLFRQSWKNPELRQPILDGYQFLKEKVGL
ncbi:MAG: Type I Iterative PKS [Bathelium mastoideum]|nr:MAG: Type I Iterative PKS [Bathelium mastoideum]